MGSTASYGDQHEARARKLETLVTIIVREADQAFEKSGGSSRHWVRDCFLPLLEAAGLRVVDANAERVVLDTAVAWEKARKSVETAPPFRGQRRFREHEAALTAAVRRLEEVRGG